MMRIEAEIQREGDEFVLRTRTRATSFLKRISENEVVVVGSQGARVLRWRLRRPRDDCC